MSGKRSFGPACFAVLAIFFLARLAVPFLPSEQWSPSGYQCASYYLFLPLHKPHSCLAGAAFGEGARVSNRRDYVAFRTERFTVDENGFRNRASDGFSRGAIPKVMLFGSSFSLGLSLNDEDTLSARLNNTLGPVVFNASNVLNLSLSEGRMAHGARAAGMRQGWIVLELLNRYSYIYAQDSPPGLAGGMRERFMNATAPLQSLERRLRNPFMLTRVSTLLNMRLADDRVLPNPDKGSFVEEQLTDGTRMLFNREDRAFFLKPYGTGTTVGALTRLRDALVRDGLRLAVILVPTGYTAYYPLMSRKEGGDSGGRYLSDLATQIAARDIPVFNCLPVLRKAAAGELAAGRLVYWPDDAHWNQAGVKVAASGIAPWLLDLIGPRVAASN